MEEHFAALNLVDGNPQQKLNRTISFSEFPCTRRMIMQQHYQSTNQPNLVRQYSCEQIFHKDSNVRQMKVSELVHTNDKKHKIIWKKSYSDIPMSTNWNSHNIFNASNPQTSSSYEPVEFMEVENTVAKEHTNFNTDSNNSITSIWPILNKNCLEGSGTTTDTSKTKTKISPATKLDYEEVKKKYRPLVPTIATKTKNNSKATFYKTVFFVLLSILVFLIAALLQRQHSAQQICDHTEDFSNASTELRKKIYGQDESMLNLSEYLEKDRNCTKVAILVGGTGVGKSYTIDIIRRNFPRQNLIFQYMSPLIFDKKFDELSLRFCNLVILENLKKEDLSNFISFWKTILQKEVCVTMLTVFHIDETNDDTNRLANLNKSVEELKVSLTRENLIPNVFIYAPLDEETLERCIKEAVVNSQVHVTEEQVYDIKQMLLTANSGCKGAYAKVQIFGEE